MAYATTYVTPGTQYDQVFTYTCTGLESNPFSIPLPAARADTNYIATVLLVSSPTFNQYLCNAPPSSYSTTAIQVITGMDPPSAGDVLSVVVRERQ